MKELAKLVTEAHGGLERWNSFSTLSAHPIQGGNSSVSRRRSST
jgi:hypothetical protein